ncbi:MAG: hypothetical protein ACRDGQ_06735 [Candidatus Limnocylindrales bacterium]
MASFFIEGLTGVMAKLSAEDAIISAKAGVALHLGAEVMATAAKANVAGHTWSGRLAGDIAVRDLSPLLVTVGARKPEAKPLEYGWTSEAGKRPPSSNRSRLLKWMHTKGIDPKLAFVIARKIGQSGYSFGPTNWLENAGKTVGAGLLGAIETAIRI